MGITVASFIFSHKHLIISAMSSLHPEELEPEHTEGFKVGQKKTIDEYQQLGT